MEGSLDKTRNSVLNRTHRHGMRIARPRNPGGRARRRRYFWPAPVALGPLGPSPFGLAAGVAFDLGEEGGGAFSVLSGTMVPWLLLGGVVGVVCAITTLPMARTIASAAAVVFIRYSVELLWIFRSYLLNRRRCAGFPSRLPRCRLQRLRVQTAQSRQGLAGTMGSPSR